MMKIRNIILSLLCSLVFISADAKPIDRNSAMQKAKAFMQEKGWTVSEEYVSSSTIAKRSAKGNANEELFYIFNATDNRGFVIVSGDDSTEEILGYCDNTAFDWENIPSSLMGWLVGTQEQIARVGERNMVSSSVSYLHAPIAPLLKSKWGQDAPYNQFCPVLDGKRTPTGCLATALAQVMYYHRWPQTATTSIPSYVTNSYKKEMPELASTTFDWASMRDTYRSTSKNDAVAELMLYVGQSMWMDYAPAGSGANDYYVPEILAYYFGYPATAKYVERNGLSIVEWDDLVYNELANKRPVLYCGYTPNWEGHAFVCDGYDGNGLYHINWGWDGYYDGYFRLSVLNPGTTSTTGSASTDDGFTEGQNVVIGIQAEDSNLVITEPWPLTSFQQSATRKIFTEFRAYDNGNYYVTLLNRDAEGNYEEVINKKTVQVKYSRRSSCEFSLGGLSDGHYTLFPATRSVDSDEWRILGSGYYYAEVDVVDYEPSVVMHPLFGLEVSNISFPQNVLSTVASTKVELEVNNPSDVFDGTLYLLAGTDETNLKQAGTVDVALMPGESMTATGTMVVPSLESLVVAVSSDSEGQNILYIKYFEDYNLLIENSDMQWDPALLTVTFSNTGNRDYKGPVVASVYQEGDKKARGTISNDITIPAGGTAQIQYTLTFSKDVTYYLTFQYLASEISSTAKKKIEDKVYVQYQTDGIVDINASDESETEIFSLTGQRLSSTTRRDVQGPQGVVITKGKKYLQR